MPSAAPASLPVPSLPASDPDVPASEFARPFALAMAPDGGLYVSDTGTNQVLHRAVDGAVTVVAGTGRGRRLG